MSFLYFSPQKIMCYIWQRFIFVFITVVQSLVYKMNTLKSIWLDIIFGIKLWRFRKAFSRIIL